MAKIGIYTQGTEFTTRDAGTSEWCAAYYEGKKYFVKKLLTPVYPDKSIGLPEPMFRAGVDGFKRVMNLKNEIYTRLRSSNEDNILAVPRDVLNYQFHICTVTEFLDSNVKPAEVCRLSEMIRLELMSTITRGMMNMHAAGVVHSDMKPQNIMILNRNGKCTLRIIDFDGSFLEENPPENAEDVVGDPVFFAPEAYRQFLDDSVRLDHRIDIFALGSIFHFLWCGKYPEKPAEQTLGEYVLRGGTPGLETSIPLPIRRMIEKMLLADPDERMPLDVVLKILNVQIDMRKKGSVPVPGKTSGAAGTVSGAAAGTASAPESTAAAAAVRTDAPKKRAKVTVTCRDMNKVMLSSYEVNITYGSSEYVNAKEIEGYTVFGEKRKLVRVDEKGHYWPVNFIYSSKVESRAKKKHPFRNFVLFLLAVFAAFTGIMTGLSFKAYNEGNYSEAMQYMEVTPFFRVIFPAEYKDTNSHLSN